MLFFSAIFFLVFGLIVGSFLNVVVFRLNTNKTFGGRSGCLSCSRQLSWHELIPVFSYLGLRGRCKNCKSKISIQYPLVEFATGILFLGLFLKFQDIFLTNTLVFAFMYIFYAFAFSVFIVIVAYDFQHKIIPDSLVLILGVWTFFGLFFLKTGDLSAQTSFYIHMPSLLEFSSGPLVALPFALLWLLSLGKWMGLGDAKLALSLGWLLGISQAFLSVVIAFWTGAIVGLLLMFFSKRYGMKSEIPFAPYLVLGTLLVFFFELRFF